MQKLTPFITLATGFMFLVATITPVFSKPLINKGKVTTLKKGQRAPFSGMLFDNLARADLLTQLKFADRECAVESKLVVGKLKAINKLRVDKLTSSLSLCRWKHTETVKIKNNHIEFLDKRITPKKKPFYKTGTFIFMMGFILGTATAIGVGFAIKKAIN